MSDTSQGPGWWQASDGKWYAPELYPKDWPKPNPAPEAAAADVTASLPAIEATEAVSAGQIGEPEAVVEAVEAVEAVDEVAPAATPAAEPAPASAFEAPRAAPESIDWGTPAPDPAAGEPTLVAGVPVVADSAPQAPPVFEPHQPAPAPAPTRPPRAQVGVADSAPLPPVGAPAAVAPDSAGGIIAILGGLLLVVGSFLAWATAAGTLTSGNVNGLSGSNGWGTLICGLAVASGGALLFARLRAWWVGAGIAAAALVAIGLVVFSMNDIGSTSDELPDVLRGAGVEETIAAGAKLDLDLGMWIVAAGAAISLVAGVLALVRRQG